jgi:acyl-CoA thioester hydrolase
VTRARAEEIPAHCVTVTRHRVRVGETDLMGVVHHSHYVGFLETGRVEYLRRRGCSYKLFIEQGFHMPVVDLRLRYQRPARFDDVLDIETRLASFGRVRVEFAYRVLKSGPTPELLTEAEVTLACVDKTLRLCPLPAEVARLLLLAEQPEFC